MRFFSIIISDISAKLDSIDKLSLTKIRKFKEVNLVKTISIATLKGGVGKTSTCFNIAAELAHRGKKVLLMDFDPQANLSSCLGVNPWEEETAATMDILDPEYREYLTKKTLLEDETGSRGKNKRVNPEVLVIKSPLEKLPSLDLIPAIAAMHATAERIYARHRRELILYSYFSHFEDFFDQYDYIFFDVHPELSTIEINVFLTSDSIILLTGPDMDEVRGIDLFQKLWGETLEEMGVEDNVKAILFNKYNSSANASRQLFQILGQQETYQKLVLKNNIPQTVQMANSKSTKTPVCLSTDRETRRLYRAIQNVVDELIEREVL
jgi:chromosome partitioning protein